MAGRPTWTLLLLLGCTSGGPPSGGLRSEDPNPPEDLDDWLCEAEGQQRCLGDVHQTCVRDQEFLAVEEEDCAAQGLHCLEPTAPASDWTYCVACTPGEMRCDENTPARCSDDGSGFVPEVACDVAGGFVCRSGSCVNACEAAVEERSNLGCDYFAADLDNVSDPPLDASRQQFAVVVSNPFDVAVSVEVLENDAEYGDPADEELVEDLVVAAGALAVIELDRREVDGASGGGGGQDNPGSKLSAAAYRIRSSHPIVAYQFNPLDNVGVFSNDASLLLPTSALDNRYVVLGWPQTVADTDDPTTDLGSDYRGFLTVIGTEEETTVTVTLSADTLPLPERPDLGEDKIAAGEPFEVTLGPYEVLNLETDGYLEDLTGSLISSDKPIAVFAGSEASDVPFVSSISERTCCADHLEEQLMPISTLGTRYAGVRTPSRTKALRDAGADVSLPPEPEWFRVVAVEEGETRVTTTLPAPYDEIVLDEIGDHVTIRVEQDFFLESDQRVAFGQFVASQEATGLPNELPGGDPAFVLVPPLEQWRDRYVFLTPGGYSFDFLTIVAPRGTEIQLDKSGLPDSCVTADLPGQAYEVHRCPLSFPEVTYGSHGAQVDPGSQGDGARTLEADRDVGIFLYGFDRFVSYAYAGGTEAERID